MTDQQIFEQPSDRATDKINQNNLDQLPTDQGDMIHTPMASAPVCYRATSRAVTFPSKVWVNFKTSIFHRMGRRWFGKTKRGELMSRKDALARGFRAAANGQ